MRNLSLKRAIVLSVGVHLLLALILFVQSLRFEKTPPQTVTIDLVPPPPPPQPRVKEDRLKVKQIVEQDKSRQSEKPEKEAFLSVQDQTVLKETVAKQHGEFQNRKTAEPSTNGKAGGAKSLEKPVAKSHPSLKDFMGQSPVEQLQEKERQRQENAEGENPSVAADSSHSNDYLKDIDAGAETLLNTREFKYFTYYNRIRRQLSQYWEPKVKEKLNRLFHQGRRIASDHDHITKLLIVLNEQGNLVRVQIVNESGVSDLDDAAMEAFRSAAPFPNPPKGIIEADGTVKIRWDFVLES